MSTVVVYCKMCVYYCILLYFFLKPGPLPNLRHATSIAKFVQFACVDRARLGRVVGQHDDALAVAGQEVHKVGGARNWVFAEPQDA